MGTARVLWRMLRGGIGLLSLPAWLGCGVFALSNTVARPTLYPPAGTYGTATRVTITSATLGASIWYTTDNTDPMSAGGTPYSAPVEVSASMTLKAVALRDGMSDSAVVTAAYEISAFGAVETPTFSPPPGRYERVQYVGITTATPGASIRYTTDGTDPSSWGGTVCTGPISVAKTLTLKAIASQGGIPDSVIASADYTIGAGAAP